MVSIQISGISEQVRDTLAEAARSRGQSLQTYLKSLLEEEARRARNLVLLEHVRSLGGGYASTAGEIVQEIDAIRAERDRRIIGGM